MSSFTIKCSSDAKRGLFKTMANVQDSVSQACESYFQRFRRTTHVTPKSFLNFISSYKNVYSKKHDEIGDMSVRMDSGLEKLYELKGGARLCPPDEDDKKATVLNRVVRWTPQASSWTETG